MPPQTTVSTAPIRALPSALDGFSVLAERVGPCPRVFLDFDGTLSDIVEDPKAAGLLPGVAPLLARLAARVPVAIISGRERADVEARVSVPGLTFAGSHGLDIRGPGFAHQVGQESRAALERVGQPVDALASEFPGVRIERKAFGLAVHYRSAAAPVHDAVQDAVSALAAPEPTLRVIRGKSVLELRPAVSWNKGDAVRWLEDLPDFTSPRGVSIYVGDDLTDEDVFAAIAETGVGVVVCGENDDRPSAARFALDSPTEVTRFLELLAAHVDPRE